MNKELTEERNKNVDDNKNNVDGRQYLTFTIGEEVYGLFLKEIREIIKPSKITCVPNTEDYIMGVINLRGKVTPVINLKNKLGLVDSINNISLNGDKRIIITSIQQVGLVGLVVDGVQEVVRVAESEIEQVSDTGRGLNQELIKGVFTSEDELIVILNLEEVLIDREKDGREV